MINGQIIRGGKIFDSSLGIVLDRVDADKRRVYFKDQQGCELSHSY
jgi:hypothetical protein